MIRKATERPKEVEYIEFKGQENFKEVAEFLNSEIELIVRASGEVYIEVYEGKRIFPGHIFYKPKGDNISWAVKPKDIFFELYKEEL
ncbi:hypothetical protein [Staphylococcus ureilyticus]|uniref:hypothetical protein n=1 Tax=Staphylococcus ureilyticus TaxID=94138 RepID=UPI0028FF4198|nr:hypothetical protein [Staphylococcus ureilyticus]MDU0461939.1 hypothetical protein [Staphylococcus ureilyticus]